MKIKNWEKLIGEKVNILGVDFFINDAVDKQDMYKASFFDVYSLEKIFDILLYKKGDWFDLKCEFHIKTLPTINNQLIRAVLRKNDVKTIYTFVSTLNSLLTKNNIIFAYFSLLSESQKINKNKNKLKPVNNVGLYGIPTGSLISKF
jgi:hypothetical protein